MLALANTNNTVCLIAALAYFNNAIITKAMTAAKPMVYKVPPKNTATSNIVIANNAKLISVVLRRLLAA